MPGSKPLTISRLAAAFRLSRSTLLYYDRIGLLEPSGRTASGYRYYAEPARERLARICALRQAGLALTDIRTMLSGKTTECARVLETRMVELGREVQVLRNQQRQLAALLGEMVAGKRPTVTDKALWIAMLRAAGMDAKAMSRWHAEFERRAPDEHEQFLGLLGIPAKEIDRIRQRSRKGQ